MSKFLHDADDAADDAADAARAMTTVELKLYKL